MPRDLAKVRPFSGVFLAAKVRQPENFTSPQAETALDRIQTRRDADGTAVMAVAARGLSDAQ